MSAGGANGIMSLSVSNWLDPGLPLFNGVIVGGAGMSVSGFLCGVLTP